ncbi:MAG: Tab2/Atab2 family RNA-binding protein, partial [Pseudanabaenaceae cyanobacterium]
MAIIWELDFYSRPVRQPDDKKLWELLVCDRPRQLEYVQVCPSDRVNSAWLADQLQALMQSRGESPLMVRYFRPSMSNMVARGCTLADVKPQPSRRLFALRDWLSERMEQVYPRMAGFQGPEPPLPLQPPV